ncbi:UNVERIFIED_CONTAM: hypothetical protein FKN15_036604 [Acipenser sinensis]
MIPCAPCDGRKGGKYTHSWTEMCASVEIACSLIPQYLAAILVTALHHCYEGCPGILFRETSGVLASVHLGPLGATTVQTVYSLQLKHCPPPFRSVNVTSVTDLQDDAVVSQEVAALLQKWALCTDPFPLEEGFYSSASP